MQMIETITRGKKKFAVLPLKQLEELLDTLEDYKILPVVEARMAALDAGLTEAFPAEFCQKLWEAKTVGERIALWREYRGISRTALGKAIGNTGQYVSMIESGKREGTLTTIHAITRALRCDLDDLMS